MLWLAGLFFLACRYVAKKFSPDNDYLKLLPFVFLALAVAALAYAPLPFGWGSIGGLLGALTGLLLGGIGGLFGVSAGAIAAILLLLIVALGLIDLIKDLKPDAWAKWKVYTTPVLVLVAAGPLTPYVRAVIDTLGGVGPDAVAALT